MEDRWDSNALETSSHPDPIAECVYCSRLIGSDASLVLHGGGNSSVKAPRPDVTGRHVDALFVKGSGWDMGSIEVAGFTPLRLARLHDLLELDALSDVDMMRELSAAKLDPAFPAPSVETLLHAYLPHRAVQHSHADVIVNLTNLAAGASADALGEIYGNDVVVVPYVMPGFDLARLVRATWPEQAHPATVGMVLMNHGLFTFGDTSEEAYRRHVDLITRAEQWLDRHAPQPEFGLAETPPLPATSTLLTDLAELRRAISEVAGTPMVMARHTGAAVARFVSRPDVASLADRGPLTPDHVIRTKRAPMVGTDVVAYAADYHNYVDAHRDRARTPVVGLDPAPRVVVDRRLGMLAIGRTAKDAGIAADIYHHTIPVLERAEDHLGGYVALSAGHLWDMEYWVLEQAKLALASAPPELTGMVALVTGAASGIGRACALELLARGAAVVGLDLAESVIAVASGPGWLGVPTDVTDPSAQRAALAAAVEHFGGIDIVVASAAFFATAPIAELTADAWRTTMAVNLDAVATLFTEVHPLLARSPVGGRVVVIASKNVPAPGKGAAAYSASKAALTQLCRVAALEWADDRIRVNVVHPDAVFDTGLWSPELLAERAAEAGLTVDAYKLRNLLHTEVTSKLVAGVVRSLCSDTFAATTGAQVPIDGGNDRVI